MARAHGARAQMALAFETVYGTPPASGYRLMPFARTTLGAEQPLIASELLGQGRDPLAPIKDAVTADGEVVVPIDVEAFGFWLKAAFGAPTTTGTTPKTHTFQSGNWTLPSMAIEVAMPEVPRFAMYAGCVMDQLSWQMNRSGLLTATARLIAQGEAIAAATAAGIFDIERQINGLDIASRLDARHRLVRPLVEELHDWMRAEQGTMSKHNPVAKAITYMFKKDRWAAFTLFLEDGRICLTNNAAERALRGVALGRKSWLFAGSERGGDRAAFMYSLIVTAKMNDIDPQAWLADVLAKLPNTTASRVQDLLPWTWQPSERQLAA